MLSLTKTVWDSMTEAEKIKYLKSKLESIKEVAEKHYKEHGGTRPRLSGTEACTWITNDITGILDVIK
jgi:hypothetical protein